MDIDVTHRARPKNLRVSGPGFPTRRFSGYTVIISFIRAIFWNRSSAEVTRWRPFPGGATYTASVIECDAEALEPMRQRADINVLGGFTMFSDEPPELGGDNSAPPPRY